MATINKAIYIMFLVSTLFVVTLFVLSLNASKIPQTLIVPIIPSIAPSPTKFIKTFENSLFRFDYPSDLTPIIRDSVTSFDTKSNNNIRVFQYTDNSKTISDFLVKHDRELSTSWEGQSAIEIQSTRKTIINGLNCIQREEYLLAADINQTTTYFKNGSTVIGISFLLIPGNIRGDDQEIYNQILSTFNFTKKSNI